MQFSKELIGELNTLILYLEIYLFIYLSVFRDKQYKFFTLKRVVLYM